jgi:ABC-type multidrug transport system permease subunit
MTFESQESTLRSIQVTPVSSSEYLLAKTLGTVTSSLVTLVLLLIYGLLFKSLDINVLGISAAVVLVSFVFGQLGILMTYSAKDFTDLLMAMFKFMLVFIIPTVIELTGLLEAKWLTAWQYINPIQHTLVLLQAASITVDRSKLWSAICYLVILGGLLYAVIRKQFPVYAAKGGA